MITKKVLSYTGVLFCVSLRLGAATLNVPSTYSTIQSAINSASSGDTVLVAAGVFVENLTIASKRVHLLS